MSKIFKRGDICYVQLDPVVGSEIQKSRPCIIISPNELNRQLRTVMIAPMTTQERNWPFRPFIEAGDIKGQIALDQVRTVDRQRCGNKIAHLHGRDIEKVLDIMQQMFAL